MQAQKKITEYFTVRRSTRRQGKQIQLLRTHNHTGLIMFRLFQITFTDIFYGQFLRIIFADILCGQSLRTVFADIFFRTVFADNLLRTIFADTLGEHQLEFLFFYLTIMSP
uniref:Uncharacterized protein n=1 Tax=Meloidogyne incognita TaxID=6306 RepID=A0A914KNW2_MELIC